ncbi:CRISPR-associated ring nuclease Csm6 [Benzoatithermus flavus]|uniref:CRISPR-associated ring nuclease Csm6 n=1 Tax=Benzoatithermus flavus TaxID=3108223 RepID=A0ABU8XVR4_9PROT
MYPHRVLLVVTGLSPQVVTETAFALAVQQQPPFVPTEIHLVTTAEGAERARLTLLGEEGALGALADEWDVPGLRSALDESRIHVVTGVDGQPLPDILIPEDNARAADLITELVRRLTASPATALHVSIAGGRKTMGFFAGYALSLYGRPQDALSHVLVPPELEQHPQFFFPPRRPRVLFGRDTKPIRAEASAVRLASIPFVRLRHGLPDRLLAGQATYAEAVGSVGAVLGAPQLLVDLAQGRIVAGGVAVPMPPVQIAFAAFFAERRAMLPDGEVAVSWRDADPKRFLELYASLVGPGHPTSARIAALLAEGMPKEWFDERKARHNKLVEAALGWNAAPYRIEATGRRPHTRFRLGLPADAITLRW